MVAGGADHGLGADRCLAGTGLSAADLEHEDALIWAHQEFRVARNILDALGDRPGIGVDIGAHSTIGRTGVIGFMLLSGPTFREGVERSLPYLALSPTHVRFSTEVEGELGYVVIDDGELPIELREFLLERDLAGLAVALRGAQIDLAPRGLETTCDRDRAELIGRAWGLGADQVNANCPVTRLVFDRESFDAPMPQADANTARLLEKQCREILEARRERVGATGQVRSRLRHDPDRWPSMQEIADDLHVDPRTLRRALDREGTSFRDLLDEARHQRARDLLARDMPVSAVADFLGYAETANFTHAFKRWEGLPPSEYRRRRRPGPG